jgi:hypothetical protein
MLAGDAMFVMISSFSILMCVESEVRTKKLRRNGSNMVFLLLLPLDVMDAMQLSTTAWGAIHQCLRIILKLRILVLLPVSTMPYVVKVKNYSYIGE